MIPSLFVDIFGDFFLILINLTTMKTETKNINDDRNPEKTDDIEIIRFLFGDNPSI